MQRICVIILAVMLAGCSTKKTPTLYGVEVKGTPFDLMERLVYDAHDQCMPVEFLPMADGMYIFAILADGEEVVIYCETDKNNQITNIKVSNTMLDINSQPTPPHTHTTSKELKISGFQLAEMLRITADLLEQQTAQTAKSKPLSILCPSSPLRLMPSVPSRPLTSMSTGHRFTPPYPGNPRQSPTSRDASIGINEERRGS